MASSDSQNNTPSKRRACDECRLQKLACLKEGNKCSRCVKKKIQCIHSTQKPMGRPKQRKFTEVKMESMADSDPFVHVDPLPQYKEHFSIDPYPDFSALPLSSDETEQPRALLGQSQSNSLCIVDDGRTVFHFGGNELNIPIDFTMDDGISGEHPAAMDVIVAEVPHESREHHIFGSPHPSSSTPGPSCSCLASMCLSMASLQKLPGDVETALSIVRVAANTAQACIRCEKCGTGMAIQSTPPIESFQNTMLLGTILPIIVNGYKRLLAMVDDETNTAKSAGNKKVFRMAAYGGIYGKQGLCKSFKHLEEAILEPDKWRHTVRGLLRADVYGDVYGIECKIIGLKGIIAELEERQRNRHKLLDHTVRNEYHDGVSQARCTSSKGVLCLQILDIAKVAINSLVIA